MSQAIGQFIMSLKISYYKDLLCNVKRGNSSGVFSNAKPYLMLSLLRAIEDGVVLGNCIRISPILKEIYTDVCRLYEPNKPITPISKPFFHLGSEPFYLLKYLPDVSPIPQAQSPSEKVIRENIDYASMDEDLWELLQDYDAREELKPAIINHYLKK